MWSLILSLFESGHAKLWVTFALIMFLTGGSCASLHMRIASHEAQSATTVKRLTTMCTHQAKNAEQIRECLE